MRRNIVLTASTAAVLVLLFAIYSLVVRDPAGALRHGPPLEQAPAADGASPDDAVRIGPEGQVVVPSGGRTEYTVYDEQTGRPTHSVAFESWRPAGGSRNEIEVTRPRLAVRLPRGQSAVVTADEGQITVDRVDRSKAAWRHGWLRGNVRIVVERDAEGAAPASQPDDAEAPWASGGVVVEMQETYFDLELGRLRTDGPLRAASRGFELEGRGLSVNWNQAANRIDELHLAEGRRLTLRDVDDFFASVPSTPARGSRTPRPDAPVPDAAAADAPRAARPGRERLTGYLCALEGAIRAEQFRGEQRVASMTAGGLRLVLDVGRGGAGEGATDEPASASRPSTGQTGRLELTWSGPFTLTPVAPAPPPPAWLERYGSLPPRAPRRRLEALGPQVVLTRGEARVECGGLEFHDESGQVWLHRGADGRVSIHLADGRQASAQAVYIERGANRVRLIGEVRLDASRPAAGGSTRAPRAPGTPPPRARGVVIDCDQWAELHLAPGAAAPSDELAGELASLARGLRSATFVGDAHVKLDDRALTAHRLDVTFREARAAEPLEALLETCVATGSVRFVGGRDELEAGRLTLGFERGATGEPFVRRADADGSVSMTREDSWLRGRQVRAVLDEPPSDPAARGERLALRALEVSGAGELYYPRRGIGARGAHIAAWVSERNEFERARVAGDAQRPALVHAAPYTIRGGTIDIDGVAQTVHVDGPSRLAFVTQRGLSGERTPPQKVLVSGERLLHVDGLNNQVRVEGNVTVVRSGESLAADTLTLFMQDAPPASRPATPAPTAADLLAQVRALLNPAGGARAGRSPRRDADPELLDFSAARVGRKEPLRLVATDALLQSQVGDSDAGPPLVHRSLAAPHIEVDLPGRTTYATGQTTLFVTDYRVDAAARRPDESPFVPSELMSGGPMQTVIRCEQRLTYAQGADASAGRDAVLLEGAVQLVHLTGRAIIDFEKIPQLARLDAQTLKQLKDRHTSLECDRLECQFGRGLAGGGAPAAPAGARAPRGPSDEPGTVLMWMLASGNVNLRDRQGPVTTEIFADRVSFDREAALVSIFGAPAAPGAAPVDARVYRWTADKFSTPYTGPEFHFDLTNNTIRASGRGEIQP